MRAINRIVVHHTATPRTTTVESIRRHHTVVNGWSDVGYHYLIDGSGTIRFGRPEWRQGAHVRGHNGDSIGVAVIGNFHRDPECLGIQEAGLDSLLQDLLYRYPNAKVLGHCDLANTFCPGSSLRMWLNDWRFESD